MILIIKENFRTVYSNLFLIAIIKIRLLVDTEILTHRDWKCPL